jgi:hypothetical protein
VHVSFTSLYPSCVLALFVEQGQSAHLHIESDLLSLDKKIIHSKVKLTCHLFSVSLVFDANLTQNLAVLSFSSQCHAFLMVISSLVYGHCSQDRMHLFDVETE